MARRDQCGRRQRAPASGALRSEAIRLRQQTEDGSVSLRVAAAYAPEDAAEAHRRLEAGGTRGRCVIAF